MMHTDLFDGGKSNAEAERALVKSVEEYDNILKNTITNAATDATNTNNETSPPRETSSEPIDVTTVPHVTTSDLSICLNVNKSAPNIITDVIMNQSYAREVHPPNSIYGIESMQSKAYEPDGKIGTDVMQSPRFTTSHAIVSPHHSSPDKESNRQQNKHENDPSWLSPVKSHNYRNPCPLTTPYLDTRDPNYPRRYLPPFFGGNRSFPPPNDRTRYGTYPLDSPLMSTLAYPRDALDSRYNLHVNPTLGFEEQKFKLSPPSMDDKHIWTKQEVELLLDLYEEHKAKLQDPRVRKTKVWDDIAKQIHDKLDADVNGCQCNQKFRNMKADYQKVVEHNTRSDSFRKTCKYFERLEKLLTPVSEADKMKIEIEGEVKFFNGFPQQNGYGSKASTPNGTTGYYEHPLSHSSSPDSSENPQNYENGTGSSNTPSSPEKRPLLHIEAVSDDASPLPPKRPCTDCNCGGISKRDLIDILKEFLKEQRKREEETIRKIQLLHREKIDTVVKFLDLFQELVKKV